MQIPIVELKYKDGTYVIESPVLELATQGSSLSQTRKRFKEVVQIFFEELVENETLESALKDLGWIKNNSNWNPPARAVSSKNEIPVTIPAYHPQKLSSHA